MKSVEFTAQLAQFSSLEQLFGVNENLNGIHDSLGVREDGKLLDYIGKAVKINDNRIGLQDGDAETGLYTLEDGAHVSILVHDADGVVVRHVDDGWREPGEHSFQWDGRDNGNDGLPDGVYAFSIRAVDRAGNEVPGHTYGYREVTGVTYEYSVPYLMVGDRQVEPSDVIAVSKSAGGSETAND